MRVPDEIAGEATPDRGPDQDLDRTIRRPLDGQLYGVLCMQGQGQPYGSLVAYAMTPDLGSAVFATQKATRKYRLLSECAHVAPRPRDCLGRPRPLRRRHPRRHPPRRRLPAQRAHRRCARLAAADGGHRVHLRRRLAGGHRDGAGARTFRSTSDVVAAMTKSMETMGSYLVLAFFAAQFAAYFAWTNLGLIVAVEGRPR